MTEVSNLGTNAAPAATDYLVAVPSLGASGIPAVLTPVAKYVGLGLQAQTSLGTISLSGTDTVAVSHGGTVYLATVSEIVTAGGGGGGGGGSPVGPIYGGIAFSRPALSAFTASHLGSYCTASEPISSSSGPINIIANVATAPATDDTCYVGIPISGSAWVRTALIESTAFMYVNQRYGLVLGDGTGKLVLFFLDFDNTQMKCENWSSSTTYVSTIAGPWPATTSKALWMRMQLASGNLSCWVSANGLTFDMVCSFALSGYLSTPTFIGSLINPRSTVSSPASYTNSLWYFA